VLFIFETFAESGTFSLLTKERAMTTDTEYDKALKDSFPASDAPANSGITGAGETDKKPSQKSDTTRTETVDESGAETPS